MNQGKDSQKRVCRDEVCETVEGMPGERAMIMYTPFFILLSISTLTVLSLVSFAKDLTDTSNRADYVIITSSGYALVAEKLADFRHRKNGFTTMIVDVDSVMAQFGKGLSPDTALKSFMQFAVKNWSEPKPQFFVLAGNINVIPSHPQPETLLGLGVAPADSILMIDQWFVDDPVSGGMITADACIGRLPAWDSSGLSIMVDKIIAYESDTSAAWCNRAISLADYRQEDGSVFEEDAARLRLFLDSLWTDTVSVHVRSDSPSHLDSTGFVNLWSEGAAIVAYTGHADPILFSYSHYFTTWSIDSLKNGGRLPVCFLGGCDLTFDTGPEVSIPTHLLDHEGGGAVAVISSEGLMFENTAVMFYTSLIQTMIKEPDEPLGKVYEATMPAWESDIAHRFTLLGDPALIAKHSLVSTRVTPPSLAPRSFALKQNYPNPFNPTTVISYQISAVSHVTLKVYDVIGRLVATLVDEKQNTGTHSVTFTADRLPSGVYFYRLEAGSYMDTKKLVVLK
ncbi:MAG TPA: C25 family cysteine peptidase [Candidatus Kryptonia bacterium]